MICMSKKIGIIGTGSYIENDVNRLGTGQYKCHEYELSAALNALENANLDSTDIDTIIVNSFNEYIAPKNADRLSYLLGAKNALSVNIDTGCSSIVSALIIGKCMIQANESKNILVVFSGNMSDFQQKNMPSSLSFINGSGAIVLREIYSSEGIIDIKSVTKGEYFGLKFIECNVSKNKTKSPQFIYNYLRNSKTMEMYKQESILGPPSLVREIIKNNGYTLHDIDYFIFHQSEITSYWIKELGISEEKVPSIVEGKERANMGFANPLVLLDRLNRNNLLQKHTKIVICVIGLGMNYGVILYEC